jgi:hypothetical protein
MIANVPLQMLIDSGASINVIDEKAYHAITKSPQNNQLSLRHTSTKIYSTAVLHLYLLLEHSPLALNRKHAQLPLLSTLLRAKMVTF